MMGKPYIPKIIYAQTAYQPNINEALSNAEKVIPFVDYCLIITDVTDIDISKINPKILIKNYEWVDDIPTYLNHIIDEARLLDIDFILFSDPDEHFCDELLASLKAILISNPQFNGFKIYGHLNIKDYLKLDVGTLAREAPGGLGADTNAWKLLLFKVENITKYEKTGHSEKCIHHTIIGDWNVMPLPKKYYYTHDKTIEDIWSSSVRNLFICGGGDNEGDNNPFYVELHKICDRLGIKTLREFIAYCRKGNIDNELKQLIIGHADDNVEYYSSEIRDMFHWYFDYLHPEENRGGIKSHFLPTNSPKVVADRIVQKAYFKILGRHSDGPGRKNYVELILNGKLNEISLCNELRVSDESIRNYVNATLFEVMGRGATTVEHQFYLPCIKDGIITDLYKFLINVAKMGQAKIAYCQMTYKTDLEDTIKNIQDMKDYVDACIVVYDNSLSIDDINRLKSAGAIAKWYRWHDNFPEMRNNYLNEARLFGANWVLVSDPDEHFDIEFRKAIRSLAMQGDLVGCNMMQINSHDVYGDDEDGVDLETPKEHIPDTYFKNLFYKLAPDVAYIGVGNTQNLHENLNGLFRGVNLPKQYFYRHIKSHKDIWAHSARNIIISGGGMNEGMNVPAYRELKPILDRLELNSWYKFRDYCKNGNIDAELAGFIQNHRNDTGNGSWDSEYRELFRWYYQLLHPEENINNLKVEAADTPPPPKSFNDEIEQYINNTYKKILKREVDDGGMNHYKNEINNGRIKKEDLDDILKNSMEYKAITGT